MPITRQSLASGVITMGVPVADERSAFLSESAERVWNPWLCLLDLHSPAVRVFAEHFNFSLHYSEVPTRYKATSIIPTPKKGKIVCLHDHYPVALISTNMKCFERLQMLHINICLPDSHDPLHVAYHCNRSSAFAFTPALHSVLEHIDYKETYFRLLFIDCGSTTNTIIPSKTSPASWT